MCLARASLKRPRFGNRDWSRPDRVRDRHLGCGELCEIVVKKTGRVRLVGECSPIKLVPILEVHLHCKHAMLLCGAILLFSSV